MFPPEQFYNVFTNTSFQHCHQIVVAIVLSKRHSNVVMQTFVQRCFIAVNKIIIYSTSQLQLFFIVAIWV